MHGTEAVSNWVAQWSHLVPMNIEGGRVLDVACGAGRHVVHFLRRGHAVTGIDISPDALARIHAQLSDEERGRCQLLTADIENAAWPLADQQFAAVIVTNYLWRPLFSDLLQSVAKGGVLIYETFSAGNETVGKPSRPDFLLEPGELMRICQQASLRVISYQDGFLDAPARFMQRIVAVREKSASISPPRYPLQP